MNRATLLSRAGLSRTLFTLMVLLSVAIGLHALGFQLRLSGDPGFHARFDQVPWTGGLHVLGGAIVLLVGGLQFWRGLRLRRPHLHRYLGRIYLLCVLVGGVAGLMLAPQSDGGLVAHLGFGLLALLWLYSAWQAYRSIRAGNVRAHRAWMIRNYALTFGAVTLRLYLGLLVGLAGVPFEEAYPAVAWLSWVPNLVIVEWYLAAVGDRRLHTDSARAGVGEPA